MTLEAWVNASAVTNWRTVVLKERTGSLSYALYGANGASRPAAYVNIGGADVGVNATANLALNTWTHLAVTYDGATIRVYVNGTQVATRAQTGPITTSTGVLRIGGNAVWSEFFQGLIDEVRIYSRALTAAEIQADMATPITP
jgi:acyl dehydratase